MHITVPLFAVLYLGPRLIIGLAFITDIIYFHKLFYFYNLLWLLLFPLIWNIIYYLIQLKYNFYQTIINTFFTTSFKYNDTMDQVIITYIPNKNQNISLNLQNEVKELYSDVIFDFQEYFINIYCSNGTMNNLLLSKTFKLLTTLSFLTGFVYLLIGYSLLFI